MSSSNAASVRLPFPSGEDPNPTNPTGYLLLNTMAKKPAVYGNAALHRVASISPQTNILLRGISYHPTRQTEPSPRLAYSSRLFLTFINMIYVKLVIMTEQLMIALFKVRYYY